jgi:hypothetical protein
MSWWTSEVETPENAFPPQYSTVLRILFGAIALVLGVLVLFVVSVFLYAFVLIGIDVLTIIFTG